MIVDRWRDGTEIGMRTGRGGPVLIGALIVDSLGNGLFLPLSLVFFTRTTDVPLTTIGVLVSIANLVTLPLPIWAGTLADRVGAVPLVIAAQLLQAAGFLGYGMVHGPVGILVAASAVAVGVRIFWSAIFTAIADYVDTSGTKVRKDTWFAWANMTRTAGLGAGGIVTGLVIADGGVATYRGIAYASAACFAVAAVTITAFVRAPRPAHDAEAGGGYRTLLRDLPFLSLTGVNTIYAMSSMMLGLALPVVVVSALTAPAWLTSPLLVTNTVLISVLAAPLVARTRRFRRTRLVIVAAVLWTLWCAMLAMLRPGNLALIVVILAAATLLYTVAESLHAPISMAIASGTAPTRYRGRYLAVFQYSFTIGSIIAPTFFTALFTANTALPWLVLGALNAASIPAVLLLERRLPASAVRDQPVTAQPAAVD